MEKKDFSIGSHVEQSKIMGLPKYIEQIEGRIIEEVFTTHEGNVSKTAKALGLKRQTLQHKLKKISKVF